MVPTWSYSISVFSIVGPFELYGVPSCFLLESRWQWILFELHRVLQLPELSTKRILRLQNIKRDIYVWSSCVWLQPFRTTRISKGRIRGTKFTSVHLASRSCSGIVERALKYFENMRCRKRMRLVVLCIYRLRERSIEPFHPKALGPKCIVQAIHSLPLPTPKKRDLSMTSRYKRQGLLSIPWMVFFAFPHSPFRTEKSLTRSCARFAPI